MTSPSLRSVTADDAPDSVQSIQAERIEYSRKDKDAWLAALPDEFLACRMWMHAWVPPAGYYDKNVNGRRVKAMNLVCDRCECEKEDRIKVTRRTVTRDSAPYMIYVPGYLAPSGMNLTKDDFRREWARRKGIFKARVS